MMEEEGAVIAGLLVGLNVIDANLCMKGEDLDSQVILLSPLPCPKLQNLIYQSCTINWNIIKTAKWTSQSVW